MSKCIVYIELYRLLLVQKQLQYLDRDIVFQVYRTSLNVSRPFPSPTHYN